jgi:hypothetical protein
MRPHVYRVAAGLPGGYAREVDDVTQDPVTAATAGQTSGVATGGGMPSQPVKDGHLTRGDWIRIGIWAIPVIFMAAAMFVSVNQLAEKSSDHDDHLRDLDRATSGLSTEQKVTSIKVERVEKKVDKVDEKVEKIDDKMDGASTDLAAIKEKLKIKDGS